MKTIRSITLSLVILAALVVAVVGVQVLPALVAPQPTPRPPAPTVDPAAILRQAQAFDAEAALAHVRELASEQYEGRRAGAPGGQRAADYIAARFHDYGLQPVGDNGTYFQGFTIDYIDLETTPELAILDKTGAVKQAFRHRQDFRELVGDRAGDGLVTGELVYLGYGEAVDFDQIDVKGRVVLCQPAGTRTTVEQAAYRGAAAVLAVTDEGAVQRRGSYSAYAAGSSLPCLLVSTAAADRLLRAAGRSLDSASTVGQPFPTGVTVRVSVPLVWTPMARARNVLGLLPGADPALADQVLILGAHYDHLGRDPGPAGALYPGAIDNASGVAVLLEIARTWQVQGFRPRVNVLFAAWDAEEAGLLGSAYYVAHPRYPLQQTRAMIQLDCVGGGRGDVLAVTEDVRNLHVALLNSASRLNFRLGILSDGFSDQASFSALGVPAVLLIWADVTPVIHVPTDTPDQVQADRLRQAGTITALTLLRLAAGEPFE